MSRRNWQKARRNIIGYEPASPRLETSREQWRETRRLVRSASLAYAVKPAPRGLKPFLGYVNPMADPRVQGYVELRYGKVVKRVGKPC